MCKLDKLTFSLYSLTTETRERKSTSNNKYDNVEFCVVSLTYSECNPL